MGGIHADEKIDHYDTSSHRSTIEISIMCLKLVILSSNSIKLRTKLKNEDEQISKGKKGKKIN